MKPSWSLDRPKLNSPSIAGVNPATIDQFYTMTSSLHHYILYLTYLTITVAVLESTTLYDGSTWPYQTLLHSTMALLDSTWLYLTILGPYYDIIITSLYTLPNNHSVYLQLGHWPQSSVRRQPMHFPHRTRGSFVLANVRIHTQNKCIVGIFVA